MYTQNHTQNYTQNTVSDRNRNDHNRQIAKSNRPGAFFRKAITAYWQARAHRANERALRALSDQALKDIGLHRCEIGSVIAENEARAEATRVRRSEQAEAGEESDAWARRAAATSGFGG